MTGRGCRSPSKRTRRRRRCTKNRAKSSSSSTPAASAPSWDRRQGAEGRDAPDRLPGGGLARDLLRLGRVRRERPARVRPRLRQHHRTAARTDPAADPDAGSGQVRKGRSPGPATTGAGAKRKRASTTGRPGRRRRRQWREPFAWMAAQRTTSPRLPGGTIAGPQVTKAFCGAVATASELINLDAQSPPAGDPHDRRRARPDRRLRRLHQMAPGGHRHAAPAARARPDPARRAPVLRPPLAGAGADRALRPGADRRRQLLRRA